ncbi:MAG: selenobiotic family peptide radical SAM maturase [Proteobacteria bacterium]|nr:selenobiotic family peptide radical SAM maturase [Pseudomonadota bacterium]
MVQISRGNRFQTIFSLCRRTLGDETWGRVLAALDEKTEPQDLPHLLDGLRDTLHLPLYITDLARIEVAWHRAQEKKTGLDQNVREILVNPSLTLIPVSWKNLFSLDHDRLQPGKGLPEPAQTHVMVWNHPESWKPDIREARNVDLLAIKMILEGIDPRQAAEMGSARVGDIHSAIHRAIDQDILISPPSNISRKQIPENNLPPGMASFFSSDTFTLQWHITQACDLHCRHCYDRSDRPDMSLSHALGILNEFYEFCGQMHVRGQVTFTGGNPMLYPDFLNLYQSAFDMGFGLAILGNPTPRDEMESLFKIAKPLYFQISLEGLEEYNDFMRGNGHFKRSMDFLDLLGEWNVFSMVMLTLGRNNLDQVLPLGHVLRDRTDYFTFNRLSTVGEGAKLLLPSKEDYETFLRNYEEALEKNPELGIKDNLLNILREEKQKKPFGGCTGYGCGAAFNFVALLPDGEVHACRKFPSPLGNIFKTPLMEIYQSDHSQQYRNGPEDCKECRLSVVCRGCMANTYSHGLNIFKDKDPFCFVS